MNKVEVHEKPIKLKIVSDGTAYGTNIYDVESGRKLEGVIRVNWRIDLKTLTAIADISIIDVPVELVSEAKIEKCRFHATDDMKVSEK